jgi:hypothetical protein
MSAGRLPEHEQRILDEMEAALDRDHRLHRRLRTVRVSSRLNAAWVATRVTRGFLMAVAALTSLILLVVGVCTSAPGVIWAFAATWSATLLGVRGAVRRRTVRRGQA